MFLPSKFREAFGEVVYMTKSVDSCISVYPAAAWEELSEKINSLPGTYSREYRRHFFSSASEAHIDSAGRILLPQNLREYAAIEKNVMVVGVGKFAEIWDSEKYATHNEAVNQSDMEKMAIELGV